MNQMPTDWSQQLEANYPARSGPSGWRGQRLFLAVRRALIDSTWEQIIDGCQRYKAYCQAAGKEGTEFVQAPQRFIEDQSYLESFTHQIPEDPRIVEARAKEADRLARLDRKGMDYGLTRYQLESAAAFETRIMLAATRGTHKDAGGAGGGRDIRSETDIGLRGPATDNRNLQQGIAVLADRMRIAK